MYHYGLTIKEHRELKGMTQEQLSEVWPKSNGDVGVSVDYVSLIENGKRYIVDINVLRQLCEILDIPLWKVGVSEYNPFHPEKLPGKGRYLYDETLDAIEELISNAWILRQTTTFPTVIKNVNVLQRLFQHLNIHTSKPSKLEFRYNSLYAQVLRLQGMIYVEQRKELLAHESFTNMHRIAKEISDPVSLALACVGIGMGYTREGNHNEAVRYLETARDHTFETSRQLSGLVLSFLARAYAKNKDQYHFEQTIDTALRIANHLNSEYGNGTDFSSHTLSDILEEKSNGYIELGLGNKTLNMRKEIDQRIVEDNNNYLYAWIPLDYAQAYLVIGEVEQSIQELQDFYGRMRNQLQSPLGLGKVLIHLRELHVKGYGDIQAVREFEKALHEEPART